MLDSRTSRVEESEIEFLEFRVGQNYYGIDIKNIIEISIPPEELSSVPGSAEHVDGIYTFRGTPISVINMFSVTKNKLEDGEKELFVVCESGEVKTALHVGNVIGIRNIHSSDVKAPPFKADHAKNSMSFTSGIADIDDTLVLMLDYPKIAKTFS